MEISPIDGRYAKETSHLKEYFSEFAYIKYRLIIEIDWLEKFLKIDEINLLNNDLFNILERIKLEFDLKECKKVKEIESRTNHDVKAIEYYIREKFEEFGISQYNNYIHFGCTSEDINNLAYVKMINGALKNHLIKQINSLMEQIKNLSEDTKDVAMISHTHGQVATPTTVGKEFSVFYHRLEYILEFIKSIRLKGKFSGAVGNFNSQIVTFPNQDWLKIAKEFVEQEGAEFNQYTTQIESHDSVCALLSNFKLYNNILLDLANDMWTYISLGYFKLKVISNEVGSSIMPHKVNPINFENAMANIRICNSLIDSLVNNLQVSRMQRDLSDSSMLRNVGVIFSHFYLVISQMKKGLSRIDVNSKKIDEDLDNSYEVLAEPIQMMLRKNGIQNSYEILKEFTRGKNISKIELDNFINSLEISSEDKEILKGLTPKNYIGIANKLI